MCVCDNSRNDVPRVAQRYGTIATHTRRRESVLVVFVVFCVHMHSVAGLIRRSIGLKKLFGHVPPVGVESSTSLVQGEHPISLRTV